MPDDIPPSNIRNCVVRKRKQMWKNVVAPAAMIFFVVCGLLHEIFTNFNAVNSFISFVFNVAGAGIGYLAGALRVGIRVVCGAVNNGLLVVEGSILNAIVFYVSLPWWIVWIVTPVVLLAVFAEVYLRVWCIKREMSPEDETPRGEFGPIELKIFVATTIVGAVLGAQSGWLLAWPQVSFDYQAVGAAVIGLVVGAIAFAIFVAAITVQIGQFLDAYTNYRKRIAKENAGENHDQ